MVWRLPSSQTTQVTLADGEDVLIGHLVAITVDGGRGIRGEFSDHHAIVYGQVASTNGGATIYLGTDGTSNQIVEVKAGAQVHHLAADPAVLLRSFSSKVVNEGLITSTTYGLYLDGSNVGTTTTVTNSGVIDATGAAVLRMGSEAFSIVNSGTIKSGNYSFQGGFAVSVDQVTNSGIMIGKIDFGGGNDLYDGAGGRLQGDVLGGSGDDRIYGGLDNDKFFGDGGNDLLDGGSGTDQMTGGAGDDKFLVDSAGDEIIEAAGEGADTVVTSVSYALSAGQHIETFATTLLAGTGAINLTGNEHAQHISGNNGINGINGGGGNDTLFGHGGNDALNGGAGADQMTGGLGNDIFYVDAVGDAVVEVANQGTDMVRSNVNYTLGADVENLVLIGATAINGTGNTLNNAITGNAAKNILSGGSGNDILNGATGADKLVGGVGNDIYLTDGGDTIVEAASQGTDTVKSSVSLTLAANLENLTLAGAASINGTGNTLGNTMTGNAAVNVLNGGLGNDVLNGGAGNDILSGGLGKDTLVGGAGSDYFVFNTAINPSTNVDRITDFSIPADTIRLENAIFTALTATGNLAAGAFVKNATGLAADANDRIIYETDTGKLFYDANGNAAGGGIHFATLAANLALTNADFAVI
jgi:Ca2+-binding RTX toxin-like protein